MHNQQWEGNLELEPKSSDRRATDEDLPIESALYSRRYYHTGPRVVANLSLEPVFQANELHPRSYSGKRVQHGYQEFVRPAL